MPEKLARGVRLRICPECGRESDGEVCPHCKNPTIDGSLLNVQRADPQIGRTVAGRYRIDGVLGRGGMGKVYVAEQITMKRNVALKVIHTQDSGEVSERMDMVRRFQREALAASRLEHHNTVRVFDFGVAEDGMLYLAMELLHGTTLNKAMRAGPMQPHRAIRIIVQVCHSLSEAHEKGVIHRDLKPDNIMLFDAAGQKDFVKVLDFGIAKIASGTGESSITQAGMIMGTPTYMAPEQATGAAPVPGTDLYALGVILYEALSGRPPFEGSTPLAILMKHTMDPVPPLVVGGLPPNVPQDLEELVLRLLAKDPKRRPASALELADLLEAIDATLPKTAGARAGEALNGKSPQEAVPTQDGPILPLSQLPILPPGRMPVPPVPGTDPSFRPSPSAGFPMLGSTTQGGTLFGRPDNRLWWIALAVIAVSGLAIALLWTGERKAGRVPAATAQPTVEVSGGIAGSPDSTPVLDPVPAPVPDPVPAPVPDPVPAPVPVPAPAPVPPPGGGAKIVTGGKPHPKPIVKPALPSCVRSRCPIKGDCVDREGRKIDGRSFCGDIAI